jgi:hypothetical protein
MRAPDARASGTVEMSVAASGYRPWRLWSDLAWAHALLWFAQSGTGGREPRQEVHLFMAGRYRRLADYYGSRGSVLRARRLGEKASWHLHRGGGDDCPEALAMAMPVPAPKPVDAVGVPHDSDDIA